MLKSVGLTGEQLPKPGNLGQGVIFGTNTRLRLSGASLPSSTQSGHYEILLKIVAVPIYSYLEKAISVMRDFNGELV